MLVCRESQDDGGIAVAHNPVLTMPLHRPREHRSLYLRPLRMSADTSS